MLEALDTFIEVAHAGTFSTVAKDRDVAVSSITRRIELLEAEVGAKLFRRTSRRLTLTDAGEQFLTRAKNIVAELAEAKEQLAALNADPRGVLTVTAPATFGRSTLLPSVASFLRRYPLIEVILHVGDEMVDLAQQRMDVAIRISSKLDGDVHAVKLASERLVVCASPSYLARRGRPPAPLDLLRHDCIDLVETHARGAMWSFEGVNQNRPLKVKGSLRTDDRACMRQAALAGVGVAHLASWLVSEDLAAGRLELLLADAKSGPARKDERSLYAVRMLGRSHDAKARLFIEHLREEIGRVPYWDQAIGQRLAMSS
jgi:DNA-binding transcriptional LysR family regulator